MRMGPRHRVLALVSGGKDSCYSMVQCVGAGHEIVALANLSPEDESGETFIIFSLAENSILLCNSFSSRD